MDGRCRDCTLEQKLKKLQVLRFITPLYEDEVYELAFSSNSNESHTKKKILRSRRVDESE